MHITLEATVLDCQNPRALAEFYCRLLRWPAELTVYGEYILVKNPSGSPTLAFQFEETYQKPHWPDEAGKPGKMAHLDFRVDSLSEAITHALDCDATEATVQFLDHEGCHVMIDPEGHPFCLISSFEDN